MGEVVSNRLSLIIGESQEVRFGALYTVRRGHQRREVRVFFVGVPFYEVGALVSSLGAVSGIVPLLSALEADVGTAVLGLCGSPLGGSPSVPPSSIRGASSIDVHGDWDVREP